MRDVDGDRRMGDDDDEVEETKIRVSLVLSPGCDESLELPQEPVAVPASIRKRGLSAVVNHLLERGDPSDSDSDSDSNDDEAEKKLPAVAFDFLLADKLLRTGLDAAARREGLSLEDAVILHYFPARPAPKSDGNSETFPDWISAVDYCRGGGDDAGTLFAGGYDGVVRAFRPKNGGGLVPEAEALAHAGPVRCLSARSVAGGAHLIATGSVDQTLITHSHSGGVFALHAAYSGGHANSVGSCAMSSASAAGEILLASGDWDGGLCLWKVPSIAENDGAENADENDGGGGNKKRSKTNKGKAKKSPSATVKEVKALRSIKAHSSNLSGMSWGFSSGDSAPDTLLTGSWDHSVKTWDVERSDCVLSLAGSKAVTCLARCSNSNVVATGHPDCAVRLWDARTDGGGNEAMGGGEGQRQFKQSHKAWVSDVRWSPVDPFVLASTSHDGSLKVWDIRSPLPLHSARASSKKSEKTLCMTYGEGGDGSNGSGVIYTGGSDCTVRRFVCNVGAGV